MGGVGLHAREPLPELPCQVLADLSGPLDLWCLAEHDHMAFRYVEDRGDMSLEIDPFVHLSLLDFG
jgi:hypothetical protein